MSAVAAFIAGVDGPLALQSCINLCLRVNSPIPAHKWGGADGPPRRQEGRIRWIPQELDPGRAVGHTEVRVAPIDATVHHPDDDTSSSRANKAPIGLPGTHLVCSDLRSTQIKERAIALRQFDRTDVGMVGKPLNLVEGDRERDD